MAKPFFPWMGNKEKLVPYIHQLIPPHVKQFTEVFGGSGAVILGLQPKKGRLDIYNDLNDDLFNVFCCVKEKSFSLAKELKFLPVHGRTPFAFYRDMAAHEPDFYRHIEEEKRVVAESTCFTEEEIRELLTILDGNAKLFDVRRAAAFLFTTYGSFSGTGNSVGIKTVDPQAIVDKLPQVSRRLDSVFLEHQDALVLIPKEDRPDGIIYADPPYMLTEKVYVAIFEGTPLEPIVPTEDESTGPAQFNWLAIAVPFGIVALVGAGTGAALFMKRRHETTEEESE